MVAVSRVIIVLSLLSQVSSAWAAETVETVDTIEYVEEMIKLVSERVNLALLDMNTKLSECRDREEITVLSSQVFPKLPLSKGDWQTVLTHLQFQAFARCAGGARATALKEFSEFKHLEKEIIGKNTTQLFANGARQYDVDDLCCEALDIQLKHEVNYRKIDPKSRQILEAVPELNQPFNLAAAVKTLGF